MKTYLCLKGCGINPDLHLTHNKVILQYKNPFSKNLSKTLVIPISIIRGYEFKKATKYQNGLLLLRYADRPIKPEWANGEWVANSDLKKSVIFPFSENSHAQEIVDALIRFHEKYYGCLTTNPHGDIFHLGRGRINQVVISPYKIDLKRRLGILALISDNITIPISSIEKIEFNRNRMLICFKSDSFHKLAGGIRPVVKTSICLGQIDDNTKKSVLEYIEQQQEFIQFQLNIADNRGDINTRFVNNVSNTTNVSLQPNKQIDRHYPDTTSFSKQNRILDKTAAPPKVEQTTVPKTSAFSNLSTFGFDDIGKFVKGIIAFVIVFGGIIVGVLSDVFRKEPTPSPVIINPRTVESNQNGGSTIHNEYQNGNHKPKLTPSNNDVHPEYDNYNTANPQTYYVDPTGNSNTTSTTDYPVSNSDVVREICWKCKGNKSVIVERMQSGTFGIDDGLWYCQECGEWFSKTNPHYHEVCNVCKGNGYIETAASNFK